MRSIFFASLLATVAVAVVQPSPARAITLNYNYSATASGGPLAGDVFTGTFQVDSSSVTAGSGLLSNLTLNVLGTTVTESEDAYSLVPKGIFAGNGALSGIYSFVVLSPARASMVGGGTGFALPSPITSLSFNGTFFYGTSPSAGETIGGGAITGSVAGVPEPASLALLGVGATGFLLSRRRKLG